MHALELRRGSPATRLGTELVQVGVVRTLGHDAAGDGQEVAVGRHDVPPLEHVGNCRSSACGRLYSL